MIFGIQSVQLVLMARCFLHHGEYPVLLNPLYGGPINFHKDRRTLRFFGMRQFAGLDKWMRHLKRRKVDNVKIILPLPEEYRAELAEPNAQNESIFCEGKEYSYVWYQDWERSFRGKKYTCRYGERAYEGYTILRGADRTPDFRQVLMEISELAEEIGCTGPWSERFKNALSCLAGERIEFKAGPKLDISFDFQGLLAENSLDIVHAAAWANVFDPGGSWAGGSCANGLRTDGSWSDAPLRAAKQQGKEAEYSRLTTILYQQMNHAVMFAVNGSTEDLEGLQDLEHSECLEQQQQAP